MKTVCTNKEIINLVYKYGADILNDERFEAEKSFIQHGNTTTHHHSLAVAYVSLYLALRSKKKLDYKSIVRGALLHDYFLYDWHEKNSYHNLHGYTHAKRSLNNARRDFPINSTESEIIYCHMFPLNITRVPHSPEARIVCIADKLCAGCETASLARFENYDDKINLLRETIPSAVVI